MRSLKKSRRPKIIICNIETKGEEFIISKDEYIQILREVGEWPDWKRISYELIFTNIDTYKNK